MRKLNKKKIAITMGMSILGLLVAGALTILIVSKNLPSIEQITSRKVSESTKIYDRTGSVLLYEISGEQKRTVLSWDEIPTYIKQATVAIEDDKFYQEPAFDWKAIVRALLANIKSGGVVQGGSTITQQLAKQAFLSPEKTVIRKIKELLLAIKLDSYYSKNEILGLYLNQIPYGPTAYGIEAAAQTYFSKPAKDLTLAQSALLAGLARAPSYYSPWGSHKQELFAREQLILKKMRSLGNITEEELAVALKESFVFSPPFSGIKAPHFVMAVQDYLTQKYGEDAVRTGGFRITTTLDWNIEQIAEKAALEGAKSNEALYKGTNASVVVEDSKTGQILAMVGSRDYFDKTIDGNFNVATQGLRQPGSALKPFVYMAAFKKGYTPDTVLFDVPTEFSTNPKCPSPPDFNNNDTNCFHPQNFDDVFLGPVTMRDALAQSRNIPAVKTLYLVGLSDAISTVQNLGLTTLNNPDLYGLSLVLGGGAVKLIDLVGAYSVLSQEGVAHPQKMIMEVKDNKGTILESFSDESNEIIDAQYPRLVTQILSDAKLRAPLFQNSLNLTTFPDYDVAIKTGTSNDYRDAWTVGYTPSFVVGVWAGNNDNTPMQRHGSSILAAVPIWHAVMNGILTNAPHETFTKPDPLTTEKPSLRGEYVINGQIHSILNYVDRKDPQGPPPQNPQADSQFQNWENGVLSWASQHVQDFQKTQGSAFSASIKTPIINISSPVNADIINGSTISVVADIKSESPLTYIRIYFNQELMKEITAINSTDYKLDTTIIPKIIDPQNIISIEATNETQEINKINLIIYKK